MILPLKPLPPLIASSLSSIRWDLSCPPPPMLYHPLEALSKPKHDDTPSPIQDILSDIPHSISLLSHKQDDDDEDNEEYNRRNLNAALSISIILLGHDHPDEAHNIITPLSWPQDTHFGHGPNRYSDACPSVVSMSSYVHSLVHRKEGFHVGEFGMVGFNNANYWTNASLKSRGWSSLPFREVRMAVLDVSRGNEEAESWCRERVIEEGGDDDDYWEPRALHELCAQVLRRNTISDGKDEEEKIMALRKFAEQAAELELRTLLYHCLMNAGYDPGTDCMALYKSSSLDVSQGVNVDEDFALSCAGRVSSAHMDAFRTNGSVTLRNILQIANFDDDSESSEELKLAADSAAAGIAARLMDVSACRMIVLSKDDDNKEADIMRGVQIYIATTESNAEVISEELSNISKNIYYGGGSLNAGDAFIVTFGSSGNDVANPKFSTSKLCRTFVPSTVDDESASFVDRLHGSRGSTPTTVVQWSKGTIHRTH